MAHFTAADTIRILVATDNHVGVNERDPVRGDDSWRTFDEIFQLAKTRDVDMVLLAGDLFHENKPSRKSMYHVMRTLRQNCFGDKPCEVEFLSDGSELFDGAFNHVNYEDENINVSIPVFSIHGNHDDPSGEGNFAALDILQASGLLNYYGRVPEADKITCRPLCLQKGRTKLALYGISNVRDERLHRTFRDGGVNWKRPEPRHEDFLNILSIHQNHHAYTETGFIPEKFIEDFMDLIIWGHEHECKIEPAWNSDKDFYVIQPGSSVATSLDRGEAVPKKVALVTVTGREWKSESIRLKTVRPFVWEDVVLRDEEEMMEIAHGNDNRPAITRFLTAKIDELIEKANQEWREQHEDQSDDEMEDEEEPMLPIVRLRVDATPPASGGEFQVENAQRFSNRFMQKVANVKDVVQFHKKRNVVHAGKKLAEMPDEKKLEELSLENIKVDQLVDGFLTAQNLTILPLNSFSNAVGQFVDKDDKSALEDFLKESLDSQVESLLGGNDDEVDGRKLEDLIKAHREQMETAYAKGEMKRAAKRQRMRKPRPSNWDSDEHGHWEDSVASLVGPEDDEANDGNDDDAASVASSSRPVKPARGKGSRGGRGGKAAAGTTRKAPAKASTTKASTAKGRKKRQPFESDEEDEDNEPDVIMIDDDDDEQESQGLFVSQAPKKPAQATRSTATKPARPAARGTASAAGVSGGGRQTQISFGGSQATNGTSRTLGRTAAAKKTQVPSDDEISDDDAFEPPPANQQRPVGSRRR